MNTVNQCLEIIDKIIYTKNASIQAKEFTHMLINHLCFKDNDKLKRILNSIIIQAEHETNILTHRGLLNILADSFPEEILNFYKTEQARRFIEEW